MLAVLYLAAMTYFGDRICRSFYRFISMQHRLATGFLVGLLLSTCITYLGSLAFARISQPLIAGNLLFLAAFAILVYKLRSSVSSNTYRPRPESRPIWDWIFLGLLVLFAGWLIFTTLGFKDGSFQIPFKAWSDFGANLSLTQSFALGHNFPTEHPFFPGEMIRYHFLFWFQAANLEFLGLTPVWSVNVLSMLSFVALLILIMSFAEILFDSAAVGRIAAFLFFFSTSLSYVPFLASHASLRDALNAIVVRTQFLPTGYPFRGEDWGVLTVDVFANQRHLISALGLLFIVLTFLIDRYRDAMGKGDSLECGGPGARFGRPSAPRRRSHQGHSQYNFSRDWTKAPPGRRTPRSRPLRLFRLLDRVIAFLEQRDFCNGDDHPGRVACTASLPDPSGYLDRHGCSDRTSAGDVVEVGSRNAARPVNIPLGIHASEPDSNCRFEISGLDIRP